MTSVPPIGSFTTTEPINSIASTESITVLGSYATNELQLINLAASLQTGVEQPAAGNPQPFNPAPQFPQFTFLGGLSSLPASTTMYGTVAAHFNTFQPDKFQLGILSTNTVKAGGNGLTYQFSNGSANATLSLTPPATYTDVTSDPFNTSQPGPAMGSIDSNLALGLLPATPGTDLVALVNPSTGSPLSRFNPLTMSAQPLTVKLTYPDPIVAYSGTFRPDLSSPKAPSALIDIQGDVQSIRGGSANGLVLNDSGNLNLVKFVNLDRSTIIGQPIGHIVVTHKLVDVTMLTPNRNVAGRGGVKVVPGLQQIGPLAFTND
jgi:hypothetical protein